MLDKSLNIKTRDCKDFESNLQIKNELWIIMGVIIVKH